MPRAHLCLPNRLYPKYAQRSRNVSRENAHNRGLGFVAEDLREPLRSTAFPQPLAGYGWPHVPLYVQSLKMERITLPPRRALPDKPTYPLGRRKQRMGRPTIAPFSTTGAVSVEYEVVAPPRVSCGLQLRVMSYPSKVAHNLTTKELSG